MTIPLSLSDGILRNLVHDFLGLLSEKERRVMHLGAIPSAFTAELMQSMMDAETDVPAIFESLQRYSILKQGEGGWYYYEPGVRAILLDFWQSMERRQEFRKANRVALTYFVALAGQTSPPAHYVFQRERLYHLMLDDEQAGLHDLADLYELALDQHQLEVAQGYLLRLKEALPLLSPLATEYASYYQARLDFSLNRREHLDLRVMDIWIRTFDALLKAKLGILLGQIWLAQYEWKKSAEILKTSLKTLNKLKAWRYAARAMLVLGDIYMDLVDHSGGLQTESRKFWGKLNHFFYLVVFMPYLVLDWLRRKISFFPGWLYFSGNYQEWILNSLLQRAGNWYRRAWRTAQAVGDSDTTLNALFGQANVAIQQRREARARQIYARLTRHPAVVSSDYRSARVMQGLGQIALLAGQPILARRELNNALKIFRTFEDTDALAHTARSLGLACNQTQDFEAGAEAFLEAFQTFRTNQDPLPQTQLYWELQELVGQFEDDGSVADSKKQQIEEALAATTRKEYLARFPSGLLRQFRRLAYLVALPFSYVLVLLIGAGASLALVAIEYAALSNTDTLSAVDYLALTVITVLPLPLTFWTIEMVYCLLGQAWIGLLGRRSLDLLSEQPDRIIVTPDLLEVNHPQLGQPTRLNWEEIHTFVSANYRLWHVPILLMSRQYLAGAEKLITLEGITSGYINLSREIQRRLGSAVKQINADMIILVSRATGLTILVAFLHALLLVFLQKGSIMVVNTKTCKETPLFLSILMVFFILDLIIVLPPTISWRIYLKRQLYDWQISRRPVQLGKFLLLAVCILLSLFAVFWLVVSPNLHLGGDAVPRPEECPIQESVFWSAQPIRHNQKSESPMQSLGISSASWLDVDNQMLTDTNQTGQYRHPFQGELVAPQDQRQRPTETASGGIVRFSEAEQVQVEEQKRRDGGEVRRAKDFERGSRVIPGEELIHNGRIVQLKSRINGWYFRPLVL